MGRCGSLGAIALIVLEGCDLAFGLTHVPDAAVTPDVAIDAPPPRCFGSGPPSGIRVCLVKPAKLFYDIDASLTTMLDTGQGAMCDQLQPQAGGLPDLCVVVAETVHIDGKLRVTGASSQSRALVLLATSELSITGTLDVSSGDAIFGAGNGGCGGSPSGNNNGGGGSGGSFGGLGGHGGGTGGGSPNPIATGVIVRGGCAGGLGDSAGGAGGRGGGAVYLIAGTALTIGDTGTVDASGAGGHGSPASGTPAGGGGGGSGGLIAIDAPNATVTGTLFANGGGGGQGSGTTSAGSAGSDPLTWSVPAPGGTMGSAGGSGGDGAATTTTAGMDGAGGIVGKGSGGGGGGIGIIKLISPGSIGGSESPAPS